MNEFEDTADMATSQPPWWPISKDDITAPWMLEDTQVSRIPHPDRKWWRVVAAFTTFACLGALGTAFLLTPKPDEPLQPTTLEVVGSVPSRDETTQSTAPTTIHQPTTSRVQTLIIPPPMVKPKPPPGPPRTVCHAV